MTDERIEVELDNPSEAEFMPRIDIIVDQDAPHARHNLNKLLYRLY